MFWDILVSLCVEHNITPSALTKELSIAKGVVTKWKNGSVPHHTTLLKIANYFGVTVEYLKGEEKEKVPVGTSDKTLEFMKLYSKLSEEQQKLVLSQIKGILSDK